MLLTGFTTYYLNDAKSWLGCKETSANSSACVDEIKSQHGKEPSIDPWCAEFVWHVLNKAFLKYGIKNPVPFTKSTWNLLTSSIDAGIRTSKIPERGAVFYFRRTGGGHVGFVDKVKRNSIITVEGNINDSVDTRDRTLTSKDFTFIHFQDFDESTGKKLNFTINNLLPKWNDNPVWT